MEKRIKTSGIKMPKPPRKKNKKPKISNVNKISKLRIYKFSKADNSSRQKVLKAYKKMQKNSSTAPLKLWLKIIGAAIFLTVVIFSVYALSQMANGNLNLNLIEGISTDKENIISADAQSSDDSTPGNDDLLILVNRRIRLNESYTPNLYEYGKGVYLSNAVSSDLDIMLTAAKKDGISLNIKSGYVSYEQQQKTYEKTIQSYEQLYGYSNVKAEAELIHKIPDGESCEQRTGLIINIDDNGSDFSKTNEYIWLYNNCTEYGFVLRYPPDKTEYTGFEASYTMFRYVGKEYAKNMRMLDMCLEQYVSYLQNR